MKLITFLVFGLLFSVQGFAISDASMTQFNKEDMMLSKWKQEVGDTSQLNNLISITVNSCMEEIQRLYGSGEYLALRNYFQYDLIDHMVTIDNEGKTHYAFEMNEHGVMFKFDLPNEVIGRDCVAQFYYDYPPDISLRID